ncbi:MAG: carbon-nitrogen hydrolase family protein [Anaerolineae bacterium]|nr:carbon-nitrogen hydrolase family protein [Anaerolineae bacterium]
MGRQVRIAAVQMDANPAPTEARLARAARLVAHAAREGADLVVLPELFNSGYAYADENHRRAETLQGPTAAWMRESAARWNVHLAGSLLLLDQDEVYNALLLFAPDGRMWRYDKLYPWGWERGYFRPGRHIAIAETDLGRIGMLICWDTAHRDLWRRYAGRVDLMVISSCPPDVGNPVYHLPGGVEVTYDDMGPLMAGMKASGRLLFGDMINQQARWLGVPAVNTVGSGHIRTRIPNGLAAMLAFLPMAPWLARHLGQAEALEASFDLLPGSKVVGADGAPLSELAQEAGEAFTVAQVTLADERPCPQEPQPPSLISGFVYFCSDVLLPATVLATYRRGLRRAWGERMAPLRPSSRQWAFLLGLGVAAGLLIGWLLGRKKR